MADQKLCKKMAAYILINKIENNSTKMYTNPIPSVQRVIKYEICFYSLYIS